MTMYNSKVYERPISSLAGLWHIPLYRSYFYHSFPSFPWWWRLLTFPTFLTIRCPASSVGLVSLKLAETLSTRLPVPSHTSPFVMKHVLLVIIPVSHRRKLRGLPWSTGGPVFHHSRRHGRGKRPGNLLQGPETGTERNRTKLTDWPSTWPGTQGEGGWVGLDDRRTM